ncbi:MAG: ABC transporter permease [Alistipes sp.]|nr:ABC transporter permease [Alistipes sp.]
MLIYTTIYSLAYGKEVVENVAVAVVDSDKTPSSRELINGLSSGPNTAVCYEMASVDEARRLFYERKVFGIVVIPNGFEDDLLSGKQANIATILDGSHLLLYRQVLEQATKDALTDGATIEAMRMVARGVDDVEAAAIIQPVEYEEHVLHNSAMGYGSFVMPSIVVVVIQQTLLIGLAMLGVRRKKMPVPNASIIIDVFAKILTYLIIYGVNLIIILGILWPIFGFPYEGRTVDVVVVFTLYITASVALGISLSHLFSKREAPLMLLLWSSIPILLLAGVSYPKEAFPEWLHLLGRVFPSSSAVNAYVNIGTAGASLGNVMTDIVTLVVLSVLYICLAFFAEKFPVKSECA